MSQIEPHQIDADALKVVRRLQAHGHKAYLVGGCVRDLLLGVTPKDFDVATSATPNQVKRLFRNCRIIGRRFRLAHIIFKGRKIIETATFRAPPTRDEARDGDEMIIWRDNEFGTEEEDAHRRDFTINGMFYDPVARKVIDHVGGVEDVKRRVIRTIGDARIRLQEDPVRILRAIKFASRLDLEISQTTARAMVEFRGTIASCSVARVLEEILRILGSGKANTAFTLLHRYGALAVLFPELAALLPPPRSVNAQEPVLALRHKGDRWWGDGEGGGEDADPEQQLALQQERLAGLLKTLLGDEEADWRAAGKTLMPHLEQLDKLAPELERPYCHALMLASTLAPLARKILDEPVPHHQAMEQLEELVQAVASRLCISRRDRQLLQLLFVSQLRMTRPGRRSRPRALIQRDYFPDAVRLLRLHHQVTGIFEDEVERWESLASDSPPPDLSSRKRRRRRRPRRRRPPTGNGGES